jgi:hypothetical protein
LPTVKTFPKGRNFRILVTLYKAPASLKRVSWEVCDFFVEDKLEKTELGQMEMRSESRPTALEQWLKNFAD